MSDAPLYGLVLAGGRSRRMRRDKAALAIRGQNQLARTYALADAVCARSFVAVRPEQADEPTRRDYPQIHDGIDGLGPAGGILAAQAAHPDAAWLVLACDLPLLEAETLTWLIGHRDTARVATAFRSSRDGLPEPLCAIYEPASRAVLQGFVDEGLHCPRKMLMRSDTGLVDQPNAHALDNVNTPEDLAEAGARIAEQQRMAG